MIKYIEYDAAIEAALSCTDPLKPIEVDTTVESIVWKLRKLPMADVQPVKHGRWVELYDDISFCRCSECEKLVGWNIIFNHNYNYCPNCGAKMDADELEKEMSKVAEMEMAYGEYLNG